MSGKMARRTKNLIRRTRGMLGNKPRCVNMDRVPELGIIGYVEVNKNATTPFSRGKVHKGIFACPKEHVDNGDIILDRGEADYYFVMDKKTEIFNGEEVYIDATMYRCDEVIDIYRFGEGIRDTFGRVVDTSAVLVAEKVRGMFNPLNFDIKEQQDRVLPDNKIKLCIQEKVGIKVADRIVTSKGTKYQVLSIDNISLQNLVFCVVDSDVR
jgi:hypothetical protein